MGSCRVDPGHCTMRHRLAALLTNHRRRFLRYASVSVVGVVCGQSLLSLFHHGFAWGATRSNVLAVTLATIPSYLLNRAWVWGRRGRHHFTREVLPFWSMAFLGLILSTIAAGWAEENLDARIWVNVANLGAFGVLWVAKYALIERYLFADDDLYRSPAEEMVS